MKNLFLTILSALALAACGGTSFGTNPSTTPPTDGGGENPPAPLTDVISKPTISCGGTDCFTGASSLALKSDVGALSSNAGYYASFLPNYYNSLKTPLSTLNADIDMMNTLLKNGGYVTCGALPTNGTLQHPSVANFSVEFKSPIIDLDMGTGHGQIHAEKRLIVSKNGTQVLEIEVHCGSDGPLQTVH
ncbi:MAG TPA: hypothetical protein PL182_11920, partial [Pseudobdellovibrionaceae bacterium]|nr:hypothetical protein [Pseudobdellovibrionaceae bacterium]